MAPIDPDDHVIDASADEAEVFAWVSRQLRFERILAALECEDTVRRGQPS